MLLAVFGLGLAEIIVLALCAAMPLLAGGIALLVVFLTQRRRPSNPDHFQEDDENAS